MLQADDPWHGFGHLAPGFNMLDPIKATVITPGLSVDGTFQERGVPALILTKYLTEHGIVVEKTGLYSFFIMFTIGITRAGGTPWSPSSSSSRTTDRNQPLWRCMPEFVAAHPKYDRIGLRELCQEMHEINRANDVAHLTTHMYTSNMECVLRPTDAYAKMAHREIDRVPIDDLEGRVTAVLLTPYPPGIPLLIPGERFNKTIVDYLKFAREFNARFPRLRDRHPCLVEEKGENGLITYFVDCVEA